MPSLEFRIVNVFTHDSQPLTGNPLCVFEAGAALDTGTMQALARQFNLSETTFILPSVNATARIRIFTPTYEMPFAGHPTLGSAFVCRALGLGGDQLRLETEAGVIAVSARGNRWTLQAIKPTWREVEESRTALASMLGLNAADIAERPLWVSTGKEQLIVPLANEAAVRRIKPNVEGISRLGSTQKHAAVYAFAPMHADQLLGRFFFPQNEAIIEDPATGSATANLGGWMIATGRYPCTLTIAQGEYVQRPSTLFLNVDQEQNIRVGGDVVEIASGIVNI